MKSYEILYTSVLAPETPVTAVAGILSRARRFNQDHGITGLLVFDGARFAHLVDGARDTVFALLEKIRLDPQHTGMKTLHYAALEHPRFIRFTTGFVATEHGDVLGMLSATEGVPALSCFVELIPLFDLDR